MRSTVASSFLLARLATATFYNGGINGTGLFYAGAYGQDEPDSGFNNSPFQDAASKPNASSSVPIYGLTWRTNVSEVSVNDATTTFESNSSAITNARVISTVYDLTWSGNGTIGPALQSEGVVAPYGCIMLIDGLGLSENVTSKYSPADNGTCSNVLGDDCVKDFLATVGPTDGSGCPAIPSPSDLPSSCAGTLGTVKNVFNGFTENLEQLMYVPEATTLKSGQGFAHMLSSAYNSTDATAALQQAESRLQVLVIKGLNAMACQKVNSTVTVSSAPTPAGAPPSVTTTNAAVVERISYGVLGLGMFGAVLLGL